MWDVGCEMWDLRCVGSGMWRNNGQWVFVIFLKTISAANTTKTPIAETPRLRLRRAESPRRVSARVLRRSSSSVLCCVLLVRLVDLGKPWSDLGVGFCLALLDSLHARRRANVQARQLSGATEVVPPPRQMGRERRC